MKEVEGNDRLCSREETRHSGKRRWRHRTERIGFKKKEQDLNLKIRN